MIMNERDHSNLAEDCKERRPTAVALLKQLQWKDAKKSTFTVQYNQLVVIDQSFNESLLCATTSFDEQLNEFSKEFVILLSKQPRCLKPASWRTGIVRQHPRDTNLRLDSSRQDSWCFESSLSPGYWQEYEQQCNFFFFVSKQP